jgi:hypothetical protein
MLAQNIWRYLFPRLWSVLELRRVIDLGGCLWPYAHGADRFDPKHDGTVPHGPSRQQYLATLATERGARGAGDNHYKA